MTIALPIRDLLDRHKKNLEVLILWHLLIYLIGAGFFFWGNRFVIARVREQVRVHDELQEKEHLFRTVSDFAYAWEYWINPDGSFRYISPSVEKLTGYSMDKFLEDPEFVKTLVVDDNLNILHDHLKNPALDGHHCEVDFRIKTRGGKQLWLRHICRPVYGEDGTFLGRRASNYNITAQKEGEMERETLIAQLQAALDRVKLLSGFLPICASCKKIRDDKGYWSQVEQYIEKHSEAVFSHGICPDCCRKLYPDLFEEGEELP